MPILAVWDKRENLIRNLIGVQGWTTSIFHKNQFLAKNGARLQSERLQIENFHITPNL